MYGVHISFLIFFLLLPVFRVVVFFLTDPVKGVFIKKVSEQKRAEFRQYAVFEYEYRLLIFYEVVNDYINNEILKPKLPLRTVVFFRAFPWIFGNMFIGIAAQPFFLFFLKFLFSIPRLAELLMCGSPC